MKWGCKYGPEYVNKLYGMVARHLSGPFRLVCFTDDADRIRPEVVCLPLPPLDCDLPQRSRGQWRKLSLWNSELAGLSGQALFLDLDSVIIGSLDDYFTLAPLEAVVLERNWAKPLSGLGQTSVFRFVIGSRPQILERFIADPQAIADRFHWEQHFVTDCVGEALRFWPRGWNRHFRLHCLGPLPLRYLRPAHRPRKARVVTFPGGPNPGEAMAGRWEADSPAYAGRRRHIAAALASPHPLQHLRQFVMPVGWIGDAWQD